MLIQLLNSNNEPIGLFQSNGKAGKPEEVASLVEKAFELSYKFEQEENITEEVKEFFPYYQLSKLDPSDDDFDMMEFAEELLDSSGITRVYVAEVTTPYL